VADPRTDQALIDWLWAGPPAADVAEVEVIEVDLEQIDDVPVGFSTG
jgi:hypothetical protein